MVRHLRSHILYVAVIIVAALLLAPPLSMAKNLPTFCNIFNKKMSEKPGSCGHRAALSKILDKGLEFEATYPGQLDLGPSQSVSVSTIPSFLFYSLESVLLSTSLRC